MKKIFCAVLLAALIFCSFSIVSHGASTTVKAPGGRVNNYDELIAALGGGDGLSLQDDRLIIVKDIILENPIVIEGGSYTLVGEGAAVSAAFDKGDLFVVTGENTVLNLGDKNESKENGDLILDGSSDKITRLGSLVRIEEGAALNLYRSVILRNSISTVSGGAIYNVGKFTMYGGQIENCKAAELGGAVYNLSEAIFSSGSIRNCSANDGGIIYNAGKVSLTGTELSGGFAVNGGAIYNEDGEIQLLSSVITKSDASKGGAIYNAGTLEISGGRISSCGNDTCLGGGIYNDKSATVDFSNGEIAFGKAKYGGGIYNLGKVNLSGGGIDSNTANVGLGILNHGKVSLVKNGYFGEKDDIFVVLTDNNAHAVSVGSDWFFNGHKLKVSCGIYNNEGYFYEYSENDRLLDLEKEIDASEYFELLNKDLGLVISDDGTLSKAPVGDAEIILYVLAAIASFAAVVSAMVFVIRCFDKKKQTR